MNMERYKMLFPKNTRAPFAEAYRALRTNIQFLIKDKNMKSIVITSAMPGEGKTVTVANLSMVLAQSGSRVLLVDADLRKPKLHNCFETKNKRKGLTNILINGESVSACVQNTDIENLDILLAGPIPPNPSELISSNFMNSFIETVGSKYDLILFDAPPVGLVTDAVILSTICDGVVFVCRAGKTTFETAKKAKQLLENVNSNILGVVLNGIEMEKGEYGYYYQSSEIWVEDNFGEKSEGVSARKRKVVFFIIPVLIVLISLAAIFTIKFCNNVEKEALGAEENVHAHYNHINSADENKKDSENIPKAVDTNNDFKLDGKQLEDKPIKYIVEPNDTLMSISFKFYNDKMKYKFIKEKNNLTNDNLTVGSVIYIYPLP